MKVMLAIFVAYFIVFFPIESSSNKGLKKVLSIVKDIKKNMINVDDVEHCLTPKIEIECGCCNENTQPNRKNATLLSLKELNELNVALENMKNVADPTNWKSFENVANYHGEPDMCKDDWNIVYPNGADGVDKRFCCVHYSDEKNPYPLFSPWHRLYMVNFELSLRSFSTNSKITLPYWDWTQKIEDTEHGLPVLAEDYWKNGPIKGQNGVTVRHPGKYFTKSEHIEKLRKKVKHAFCHQHYIHYDIDIQNPHNTVHNRVGGHGGQMSTISHSAYDPIFYLHHSFVDLQYAYWQKLQCLRQRDVNAPRSSHREMPPFSNYTTPDDIQNVNPFSITKQYGTQLSTNAYKTNFNYQYDQLIFDGKTPEEFHNAFDPCTEKFHLGFTPMDYTKSSTNKIYAVYNGEDYEVHIYHTFPMGKNPASGIHHTADVTEFFEER